MLRSYEEMTAIINMCKSSCTLAPRCPHSGVSVTTMRGRKEEDSPNTRAEHLTTRAGCESVNHHKTPLAIFTPLRHKEVMPIF